MKAIKEILKKYEMNDFLKCVYSMYYIKHALVNRE